MNNLFQSVRFGFAAAALALSLPAHSAVTACNAPEAVSTFQNVAQDIVELLPRLDANVDKCFNPSRPSYIQQTHQLLGNLDAQLRTSLQNVTSQYQRGNNAGLANAIGQAVQGIAAVSKPVFDNASNLKRHGFTTSDSVENGQYKYPQCNSRNNDRPAEIWASVYGNVTQLRQMQNALLHVANCLQQQ